jgi:hypothetical protein
MLSRTRAHIAGKHARAGAKSSSSKVRSRKNSASGAAELVLGGCNGNGLDEGMQQADTRVSPEIYKFAMLSGQSMLTIGEPVPSCWVEFVCAKPRVECVVWGFVCMCVTRMPCSTRGTNLCQR